MREHGCSTISQTLPNRLPQSRVDRLELVLVDHLLHEFAAQAEEETARREVAAGLSEAWKSWRMARNRHKTFSEQIAKDRAQLAGDARDLFAAGRIGYTELLQARREWRQAELSAVESWRASMISAWQVLCHLGYNETEPWDKKGT